MNETKYMQDGYIEQSKLLHWALQLCDSSNRASLGLILHHPGIESSRFGRDEEWVRMAGTIRFRLRKHSSFQQPGMPEGLYFHRLLVTCPCCGREIPAGRLHQHAMVHVNARMAVRDQRENGYVTRSVYHPNWYVDPSSGDWKRVPRQWQRSFPQQPAGF